MGAGYTNDVLADGGASVYRRGAVSLPGKASSAQPCRRSCSPCWLRGAGSCDLQAKLRRPWESLAGRRPWFLCCAGAILCMISSLYALSEFLRPFFGLPGGERRFLSRSLRQVLRLTDDGPPATFRSLVVPMGWNWAAHCIQQGQEFLLRGVAPEAEWLRDKVPARQVQGHDFVKLLYIVNSAALSTLASQCSRVLDEMLDTLGRHSVMAHQDPPAEEGLTLLGFELRDQGHVCRPSRKKFWKVAGALEYEVAPGRLLTGKEVEELLGHLVSILLLRRESLAILSAAYHFVSVSYNCRQPLWAGVKAELRMCLDLLPTVVASGNDGLAVAPAGAGRRRLHDGVWRLHDTLGPRGRHLDRWLGGDCALPRATCDFRSATQAGA